MCTVPDEEALSPAPLLLSSEWLLGMRARDVGSWWPCVLEHLGLCLLVGQSELGWAAITFVWLSTLAQSPSQRGVDLGAGSSEHQSEMGAPGPPLLCDGLSSPGTRGC